MTFHTPEDDTLLVFTCPECAWRGETYYCGPHRCPRCGAWAKLVTRPSIVQWYLLGAIAGGIFYGLWTVLKGGY
jgi:hypothetical protein